MKKIITTLLVISSLLNLSAQSIDEKVINLITVDGSLTSIEKLIEETIDYQKNTNPNISEIFWLSLKTDLAELAIPDLIELIIPIYKKSFSERQIDGLIEFYNSELGKELVLIQPQVVENLNMPMMQWFQNISSQIIEKIENRGNETPSLNEIDKFEQDFKNQFGLQILNLTELTLDKEHNPGTLLIDFGKSDGINDITKEIIIKNNTDSLLTFEEPLFLVSDDITFDWGDAPIKPKEVRALKFILKAKGIKEGETYSTMTIMPNVGSFFAVGVKYRADPKEIRYTVSNERLRFKEFEEDYSKKYEFTITNKGNTSFRILDIELDKSIAYILFDRNMVEPSENTTIKVLFDKELAYKMDKIELNLEIQLTKTNDRGVHAYAHKTFDVEIR